LTLPGAGEGVLYLFTPDFSELKGESVLRALGLSFFSLSIGMGAMLTYASYLKKNVHLGRMSVEVAALDTGIAIIAGLAIFPALFALGMDPAAGPGLVFQILPQVFAEMPMGRAVGCAFFLLVFIAALTSAVSIIEPIVTILVDDLNILRHKAVTIVASAVFVGGAIVSLSMGGSPFLANLKLPFLGGPVGIFDFLDLTVDLILLPLGGLIACLFLAFGWNRQKALQEVMCEGQPVTKVVILWHRVVTTVAPIAILFLMVTTLYSKMNPAPEAPEPAPAVMIEEAVEDAVEALPDPADLVPETDAAVEE
jgi:neurotransmitter:Na+ symporter, NSS family